MRRQRSFWAWLMRPCSPRTSGDRVLAGLERRRLGGGGLESGQPYRAEVPIRTTSGRDLVLDWGLQRVEVGGRSGLLLVFADVTERARLQGTLRLTEFSMNHASDSIFWVGPEGRLVEVSESTCRRLGYSREELLGMTLPDISAETTTVDWSPKWAEIKRRVSCTFESRHKTRAGEAFPVQ